MGRAWYARRWRPRLRVLLITVLLLVRGQCTTCRSVSVLVSEKKASRPDNPSPPDCPSPGPPAYLQLRPSCRPPLECSRCRCPLRALKARGGALLGRAWFARCWRSRLRVLLITVLLLVRGLGLGLSDTPSRPVYNVPLCIREEGVSDSPSPSPKVKGVCDRDQCTWPKAGGCDGRAETPSGNVHRALGA